MGGLLGVDGPFYKFGSAIADVFIIGLLWFIFSIPVVTMGASTAAAYYIFTKRAENKDTYLFKGFAISFKENLLQGVIAFLILAVAFYGVWLNLTLLGEVDLGPVGFPVQIALLFVAIQLIFISMYAFVIMSRFEMKLLDIFKNALLLAYRHLFFTFGNVVLLLIALLAILVLPILIFVMPGIYFYVSSFGFLRVFQKNKPADF